MLGRQHLMLSLATVSVALAPHLQRLEGFAVAIFLGAGIGSLIPDVDAPDAAVFHENIRGLNGDFGSAINKFIGPLLPVFGYTTKYLIFKPSVKLFDFITSNSYSFQEKHRTFSHSILGVITMTVVTGLYMIPVLKSIELYAPMYLLAFLAAYMIGSFLHMLEDSCTKTGIAWNSPFSKTKLKGDISTGKDIKKPKYFLYWLGAIAVTTLLISDSTQFDITTNELTLGSLLLLAMSWLIFLKGIAKVKTAK